MAFKLAVANTVIVPVKFTVNNAGKEEQHNFSLDCARLMQNEITAKTKQGDGLISDFMKGVTRNWSDQRLVIDDENNPVPFSAEAFDVMLSLPGLPAVAFNSYLKECGAKEKN
ncbi:hypothetical protein [Noviherbaspirillum denitrificans]|uniref:Phage tail protein n=1 Tax=Noviherbaspirillum denitrificans TaxID=1968433 RepID=A0A254T6X5_9BURK|nr:hypothetical protein [Noviherbaspirillum denitrificans]OWW18409.1 hypothetical protein AYR66_00995 [Noviherbaspirillum denitrificans]OWW19373.1 hypothetical protein AYR66_07480 [Noviherbaspirillum denitrificans]